MIDIKELRRLAQAAIAKMNASDPEFASSTPPLAILELLDRLEAAESECLEQARLNGMGSEREAALMAKLEAAEKDIAIKEEVIDSLAAVVKRLDAQCDAAEKERDALRAELDALKSQEPVAWLIDWADEPDLGHYFSESAVDEDSGRSRPLFLHPVPASVPEGVAVGAD